MPETVLGAFWESYSLLWEMSEALFILIATCVKPEVAPGSLRVEEICVPVLPDRQGSLLKAVVSGCSGCLRDGCVPEDGLAGDCNEVTQHSECTWWVYPEPLFCA